MTSSENKRKFLGWRFGGNIQTDDPTQLDASVDILEEVLAERSKQIEKWGTDYDLSQHELLSIATEEIGEVAKDINDISNLYRELSSEEKNLKFLRGSIEVENAEARIRDIERQVKALKSNLRNEWVQLAAVAAKAIEIFDAQQE